MRRREQDRLAAVETLDVAKRVVCAFVQPRRRVGAVGIGREADRTADPDVELAKMERRADRRDEPLTESDDRGRRLEARNDQRKFVAAQTIQHRAIFETGFHPPRRLDQQTVSDEMAIGVVDRLEAVEIDDADRERLAAVMRARERVVERGKEAAPVAEVRETVEIG